MELRPHRLRIGTLLGVQGTPATLIGNQLVPGAVPYDELEQLVKAELAKRSWPSGAKPWRKMQS